MKKEYFCIALLLVLITTGCNNKSNYEIAFTDMMNDEILNEDIIFGLNSTELRLLRNGIFAKHGYPFSSDELYHYYYAPGAEPLGYTFNINDNYNDKMLSENDIRNIESILVIENDEKTIVIENKEKVEDKEQYLSQTVSEIYSILNSDPISFNPNLSGKYDTELKRKTFMETDEYQELLDDIKIKREELITTDYRINISEYIQINPYDLELQGFVLNLPYSGYWLNRDIVMVGYNDEETLTQIAGFYSNDTYRIMYNLSPKGIVQILIKCPENIAIEIENNISNIRLEMGFRISGEKYTKFNEAASYGITHSYPIIHTNSNKYYFFFNDKLIYTGEAYNSFR